jgi:TolB protein
MELTKITSEYMPEFYPVPSADAKSLLVTVRDPAKQGPDQWSIVSVRIGAAGRQLVAGSGSLDPTWMSDGNSLIYSYVKYGKSRLVRSGKGSAITYVNAAPLGDGDGAPNLSPDGTRLALHTLIGNEWVVATLGTDGSLFTMLCPGLRPKWSPDGTRLLFYREAGDFAHIFTIDLASGQVTQLTDGKHNNLYPCWSPDGGWIAFISDREEGRRHLYVMNSNGALVTRYTTGKTDELLPSWSSDGYIYFCSNAGGKSVSKDNPQVLPTTWDYSDIWRIKPILPK